MTPTATYVYCLVAGARQPRAARADRRLPGSGPIRFIEQGKTSGGLKTWLVVSDVPLERYGESAINQRLSDLDWVSRLAVAHEAVVETFIGAPALVPMKLFTIFVNDERASAHIGAHRQRIDAAVKRVRGCVELGVRVTLDRARASLLVTRSSRAGDATGAAYLAGKKAQRDRAAELASHARDVVGDLYEDLESRAKDAVRRAASELPVKGGPLLLDAAFLVQRTRAGRFRAAVDRHAKALEPNGYRVIATGPWPPYTFVRD